MKIKLNYTTRSGASVSHFTSSVLLALKTLKEVKRQGGSGRVCIN